MPKFVKNTLIKLQHSPPTKPQHSPHMHTSPIYGQQQKNTPPTDTSPYLDATETRHIQRIVDSFLYYARVVDPTILPGMNKLGLSQARPTENTARKKHN